MWAVALDGVHIVEVGGTDFVLTLDNASTVKRSETAPYEDLNTNCAVILLKVYSGSWFRFYL